MSDIATGTGMTIDESDNAVESPAIAALRAKLEQGDAGAVDAFWESIAEQGTPLYEPNPDREDSTLVTFLWKETDPVANVLLVHHFRGRDFHEDDLLVRLGQTNLWYRTIAVSSRMRATYQLGLNDSLATLTQENREERTRNWRYDPLNQRNFVQFLPEMEGGEPAIASPLVLPMAPPQPWLGKREGVPSGSISTHSFISSILGNERDVTVYTPHGYERGKSSWPLLLHFDAQWLETPMQIPTTLDNLIDAGAIPPSVAVFVSNVDRNTELPCNEDYARALATEMIPSLRDAYGVSADPTDIVAAGQSYGGLASAWIALQHPDVVGNVLSQSGSFWWGQGVDAWEQPAVFGDAPRFQWLNEQYALRDQVQVRFWMQAGAMEAGPSSHGYVPSLLVSNRNLYDILRAKSYEVHYEEYVGGHDFVTWRGSLADGLIHLLGR
jgi:enterochelin esterase family protein